ELLSLLREKPLETLGKLGALGTSLGAVAAGVGFVTLRAREALLGSPDLSYPYQEWLVTGFSALASLFWRGISVLVSDHPVLRGSAWALLFLLLGLVLAARLQRRPALLLGILGTSVLLLAVGSGFYRIALAATAAPNVGPSRGLRCGERLSGNLADQAAFETCSWLVNDSPRNDMRRSDLGGLLGWLLAACLTAIVAGARTPVGSRRLSRLRWMLIGAHALLGLLLLYDLPRAHAFATWGLRYPQVWIQKDCDPPLVQATAHGNCRAFDVSAGAEKKMIFIQGSGCPTGRNGSFVPMKSECLLTLSSPPRAIS
ncbi:MAG TPA: hypothetical protein VLX28_14550, partial [Thermoanaerobaculia bacterium]|nr:hypothetical protein [Thermoanaerobaculia bacterium]